MTTLSRYFVLAMLLAYSAVSIAGTLEENSQRLFGRQICLTLEATTEHIDRDHHYNPEYIAPSYALNEYARVVAWSKHAYKLAVNVEPLERGPFFKTADELNVPELRELPCQAVVEDYLSAIKRRAVLGPYQRSLFEVLFEDYINPFFAFVEKAFYIILGIGILGAITFYEAFLINRFCAKFHFGAFIFSLVLSPAGGTLVALILKFLSKLIGASWRPSVWITSAAVYIIIFGV